MQKDRSMAAVDLEDVRHDLMQYGWIKDARVSRRLPDTLVVDIVERSPAAIWQHNNRLSLIDEKGVVLEPVSVATMPDLPLVIGPRANQRAQDLERLLAEASSLKELLAGATSGRQPPLGPSFPQRRDAVASRRRARGEGGARQIRAYGRRQPAARPRHPALRHA